MVLFPGTSFNLHILVYVFLVLTLVLTDCSSIILNNIHHKQCKHHHYIDLGSNCISATKNIHFTYYKHLSLIHLLSLSKLTSTT